MRLSIRIIALFYASFLVLLAADSYVLVRREVQLLDQDMLRDAMHQGRTYGDLLAQAARLEGPERALDLVQRIDREDQDVRVRWTWLDSLARADSAPRLDRAETAPLLEGREVSVKRTGPGGAAYRFTYVPVVLDENRPGALELTESLAPLQGYRRRIVTRSLLMGGLMALIGLVLSWFIGVHLLGRPLQQMMRKTRLIGAGDFSCDLQLPGRGELSDLSLAMNQMCRQLEQARDELEAESRARIEALEQLRHTERLAVLGRISSGLAHELGTPLNVVSGRAKMIGSGDLSGDEIADSVRIIRERTEHMTGIIRQFLDYARRPSSRRRPERIEGLAAGVSRMLQPTAGAAGVTLTLTADDDLPEVPADRAQLEQVLTNLVMNAIHAMPGGGEVRIAIARERGDADADSGPDAGGVVIRIADEGVGIDPEDLPLIFEPFYTTKPVGKGTGLGLSIVKGIVEEHGGRIEAASDKGRGTVFTVRLPLEAKA